MRRLNDSRALQGKLFYCLEQLEVRLLLTTLYWNPSLASGLHAGSGSWNSSSLNWSTSTTGADHVAWIPGADAVFYVAGTSKVSVSGNIAANSITFAGSGYTLNGSGTLTLSGDASIAANAPATVHTTITGSAGLNSVGSATLALTGANNYTGPTSLFSGILVLQNSATQPLANAAVTLTGGTLRNRGTLNLAGSLTLTSAATLSNFGTLTLLPSSTLSLKGDVSMNNDIGPSLVNQRGATFTWSGGNISLTENSSITNAGSMTFDPGPSGVLLLAGYPGPRQSGSLIKNTGTLTWNSGMTVVSLLSSLKNTGILNLGNAAGAPGAPTRPSASTTADPSAIGTLQGRRVTLTWTPASTDPMAIAGYEVFRRYGNTLTLVGTTANLTDPNNTSQVSFTDTAPANSTTYYYSVVAIDSDGRTSARSSEIAVTTGPATPVTVPAALAPYYNNLVQHGGIPGGYGGNVFYDYNQLQSMINTAVQNNISIVPIPAGKFYLMHQLIISTPNLTLSGQGDQTILAITGNYGAGWSPIDGSLSSGEAIRVESSFITDPNATPVDPFDLSSAHRAFNHSLDAAPGPNTLILRGDATTGSAPITPGSVLLLNNGKGGTQQLETAGGGTLGLGSFFEFAPNEFVTVQSLSYDPNANLTSITLTDNLMGSPADYANIAPLDRTGYNSLETYAHVKVVAPGHFAQNVTIQNLAIAQQNGVACEATFGYYTDRLTCQNINVVNSESYSFGGVNIASSTNFLFKNIAAITPPMAINSTRNGTILSSLGHIPLEEGCVNTTVFGNILTGIWLGDMPCANNTISNNLVTALDSWVVYLREGTNNTLAWNQILGSYRSSQSIGLGHAKNTHTHHNVAGATASAYVDYYPAGNNLVTLNSWQ